MTPLLALAYAADGAVVATYLSLVRTGRARAFHWANALGCLPLIAVEIGAHAFAPLVLTAFFGLGGWYGVLKGKR